MVKKVFYLLLFWAVFVPIGSAQTIQWLIEPKYDSVGYLNGSVLICKTGGHFQLINAKGRELLAPVADSVTHYNENRAIVLDKKGNRYKIRGIVDESGIITSVNGDFYANNYSFYSEGFISVVDASGKAGYLDVNGNLAIPCRYRIARPFMKGWASVVPAKRKPQTLYIDSRGKAMKLNWFHDGNVVTGSSFNASGEALIAYYDNDNAIINSHGTFLRKYEKKENLIPIRKHDFSFDESGENKVPVFLPDISYDKSPMPFATENMKGYKVADHLVAPPQFSQAERFVDGYAIVCKDNKFGVVKLVDGSFSGEFTGEDLTVAAGQQVPTYTYSLVVPESMKSKVLQVRVDAGDGKLRDVMFQNGRCEFTPYLDDEADVCVMRVQVVSDGLLLWEDSIEKSITNVSIDIGLPEAVSERANEQDEFRVRSVITNNSNSSVIVTGIFYASFANGSKNKFGKYSFWQKIAPNSQKEIFADLIVVDEESVKVSVSVKVDKKTYGTKSAVIQLKPFY